MAVSEHDREALLARLRRVEGQIRGIQRMVEQNKDCADTLVQIAAARSALDQVGRLLLENHVCGCIRRGIVEQDVEAVLDELTGAIRRLIG